ncbi:hypothetical protein [Streptomyces sp. NPDC017964]|uniref:hypothetical protein n=1 Tax=Streptomyces sp. NPDC017964 TaxID=3365022 RepID=UPI0037B47E0A
MPPIETDHVIAVTGFRASCGRTGMLAPVLRAGLGAGAQATPRVGSGFEPRRPGGVPRGPDDGGGFGPLDALR